MSEVTLQGKYDLQLERKTYNSNGLYTGRYYSYMPENGIERAEFFVSANGSMAESLSRNLARN